MSTHANLKEVYREYIQVVWNQKNLAGLQNYFIPDFLDHTTPPGMPSGLEGTRQLFGMIQSAFPDHETNIELLITEGDLVAARLIEVGTHRGMLFSIPATGYRIRMSSTHIVRFRHRKMCEHWSHSDDLSLMQQLGAIQISGH